VTVREEQRFMDENLSL